MKEELSKKAIVIVYPDGYVDAIDIKNGVIFHNDYFELIRASSLRILDYCNEIILSLSDHYIIEKELTINGCVVILNWDIRNEKEEGKYSDLFFLLPAEYGSIEQAKITRQMIVDYPVNSRYLNVFDQTIKRCRSADDEEILNSLNEQINKKEEGIKNGKF